MIRFLPALLTRPVALATSMALHVGALVAGGHALAEGAEETSEPRGALEIAIELQEAPVAPLRTPTSDEEPATTAPARARRAGHRHAYPVPQDHDAHPHDPALVHLVNDATLATMREAPPLVTAPSAPTHVLAAPPSVAPTSEAPLRFDLSSARFATHGATSPPASASEGAASDTGAGTRTTIFPESAVDVPARLLSSIPVVYPEAARAAGIEADIRLDLVVDGSGRVTSAHAGGAQDRGLADAAVRAVRGYRFTPARRADLPVPVRMRWTVTFRLQ
jgi:protein TonB